MCSHQSLLQPSCWKVHSRYKQNSNTDFPCTEHVTIYVMSAEGKRFLHCRQHFISFISGCQFGRWWKVYSQACRYASNVTGSPYVLSTQSHRLHESDIPLTHSNIRYASKGQRQHSKWWSKATSWEEWQSNLHHRVKHDTIKEKGRIPSISRQDT
jgi:hypothetical protein